jgi:hypothetical protein
LDRGSRAAAGAVRQLGEQKLMSQQTMVSGRQPASQSRLGACAPRKPRAALAQWSNLHALSLRHPGSQFASLDNVRIAQVIYNQVIKIAGPSRRSFC